MDVPLTPLVDSKAPKKLMRMGSSAGIAMRARAAARRVRAQVHAPHPLGWGSLAFITHTYPVLSCTLADFLDLISVVGPGDLPAGR